MKYIKLFFVICVWFFFSLPIFADVMPYYTGAISKNTIGFVQVPKNFNLHLYPRDDSDVVDTVNFDKYQVKLKNKSVEPSEVFIAQITENSTAWCMAIDSHDDWYKVVYDKMENKSAWYKPQNPNDYWSLKDFYTYYGKKHGLYYMKDVDYRKRGIYSGAMLGSQKLGSFTLIKMIRLNKISGNFALVTVTDIGELPKIGYIQWREPDGKILIFPKLDY